MKDDIVWNEFPDVPIPKDRDILIKLGNNKVCCARYYWEYLDRYITIFEDSGESFNVNYYQLAPSIQAWRENAKIV